MSNPAELPPIFQYLTQANHWFQTHQWQAWGGLGALFAAGLVGKTLRRRQPKELTTHGSARWATPKEVAKAGLSEAHGVVLGVHNGTLWLDDSPLHLALFAPTGGGKDTFHINPTLHWGWTQSAIINDPKDGQSYDATGQARAQFGRVEAFAPYKSPLACINILDSLRIKDPHEFGDAVLIGQSLTAPDKIAVRESSGGVHFREMAALTIAAGSLHCRYENDQASLPTVWHFLSQQGTFKQVLETLRKTPHTRWGVHQLILEMSNVVQNAVGEELGSVSTTTIRPLLLYADPYVAASTERSTINIEDLQYGPCPLSLYLLAPSPRAVNRLYPIYRVILDVVFARLMEHKPQTYKHRLLFVGNELPTYGYSQSINKGAADMRDYGMKGFFIGQDIHQFDETFGAESDIWSNTACKLFHAPANDKSAERISRNFLGDQTVEYFVASQQGGRRPTVTPHRTSRKLLTPDEVRGLKRSQFIALVDNCPHPILFDKFGYDPRLAGA
jgi:type IV secretion system protein VirD4